jgi:hypothetical protein
MGVDFALVVSILNFTNYLLENADAPGVNIPSMIFLVVGSTMVISVVSSGFH